MSARGVLAASSFVLTVVLFSLSPRLHHSFPSLVDDWSAIENAPAQLSEIIRGGNPERIRYRPGFVAWNVLQWHTLGAPRQFFGPEFWNLLRVSVLVVGLTSLTALLAGARPIGAVPRAMVVTGAPLAVLTLPLLMVDLARYGPQEPLLVGCASLASVLLIRTIDRVLDGASFGLRPWVIAIAGIVLWIFGVTQKETSLCLLVLVPFLVPTIRAQASRWSALSRRGRIALVTVACAVALPFGPMLFRTTQLSLADNKVYDAEFQAGTGLLAMVWNQIESASRTVDSPSATVIGLVACCAVLAVMVRRGPDWIGLGLLVTALAFVVFAAQSGVIVSRYYLPPLALAAVSLGRSAAALGPTVSKIVGGALLLIGLASAVVGRDRVDDWEKNERLQELVVREIAAREAGGCSVSVTGLNVEFVAAAPVLARLAHEPARDCSPGESFVVVMDALAPGDVTPPDDPVLVTCRPESVPVWENSMGKLYRCTVRAS